MKDWVAWEARRDDIISRCKERGNVVLTLCERCKPDGNAEELTGGARQSMCDACGADIPPMGNGMNGGRNYWSHYLERAGCAGAIALADTTCTLVAMLHPDLTDDQRRAAEGELWPIPPAPDSPLGSSFGAMCVHLEMEYPRGVTPPANLNDALVAHTEPCPGCGKLVTDWRKRDG